MELLLITCLLFSQTIDLDGKSHRFPKLTYILGIELRPLSSQHLYICRKEMMMEGLLQT